MASAAPVTPMLGERRTRSARSAAPDKENCPPPKDNSVPGVFATPIGKGIAAAEGKTPGANFATPAGKTGEAPKTLEQWNAILRSLPIAMPSDRARLERLFERVLGSGSGNEELDVASNKDTDVYVALWLYRIALDPEEGTTYTKFMRKWGIGRKYAVVYVQQALMASEDKAHKALQDGIDADAQPAQLLEELLTRHSGGEDLKAACTAVLKGFPDAEAMLNSKQTCTGPAATAAASSFSTPAPKAQASAPERGRACDETIVEEDGKAHGTARADAEETVMFGAKLSAAKSVPSVPRASSVSTPSAATPKPTATPSTQKSSSAGQREDTVTFGSKITTPGAEARAAAAAAEAAGDSHGGKTALKKGAVRSVKRTGLGGGPARRVNQMSEEDSNAGDKTVEAPTAPAPSSTSEQGAGIRTTPLAYKSSLNGGCVVGGVEEARGGAGGGGMLSSDLPPISEQEGRLSGESAGNTSTSSNGSNDSVNRSASEDGARRRGDETTKLVSETEPPQGLGDMQTQPLHHSDAHGDHEHLVDRDASQEQSHRAEGLPQHQALVDGHRPCFHPDEVPKGFIAVRDTLYKKIEVKGKGGGGKVYKVCEQDNEDSIWAIKKIKLDGDDDVRASVLNEIELLIALRGESSIIHMKDYEVGDDYVHMVMECGEQDLAQALQRKQVRSLRGVWKAMMEAVQVVHEKRVVHGDLKPANFLMVNKELKLIDFGIAKQIESNDTTNIVRENAIGTLNYMAPEAFVGNQGTRKGDQGLKLGRQSDIWSLGCILYQMVYGRPPFHAYKNTIQKMQAITGGAKIDFPAAGPAGNVEKDLIDVMKRTLERDPSKRPSIPELKRHPWLVPPKFGLDAYNILVMVSKVRAMHRENPERTDEEMKETLITLMSNAGLALPTTSPTAAPAQPKPAPKAASAPPPPPPPPAPAPPPPPPPAAAGAAALASKGKAAVPADAECPVYSQCLGQLVASPGGIAAAAAAAANRRATAADNGQGPGSGVAVKSGASVGGVGSGLNMQEVLAQRNKLRKVEKDPSDSSKKPEEEDGALNVKGLIKHGLQNIRKHVADDTGSFSNHSGSVDFTSEFTSEFNR